MNLRLLKTAPGKKWRRVISARRRRDEVAYHQKQRNKALRRERFA